jgi:cytochrome c oxidase subunit 2
MATAVNVMPKAAFDKWYNDTTLVVPGGKTATAGAAGLNIMRKNGCIACHSVDGSTIVGPSFKGIFGEKTTVLVNGKEQQVTVDEKYVHESLMEPNVKIVKGFRPGLMQSYKGIITEDEIKQITEFLQTLK